MNKWYIIELLSLMIAVAALTLTFFVADWWLVVAAMFGGIWLTLTIVEEALKRCAGAESAEETEDSFKQWLKEQDYEGMLY